MVDASGSSSLAGADPALPSPGRVAERYTLFEQLGAGGTATVHRARDEVTGRTVALKQLSSSPADKRRTLLEALFEREYHTLVRLKHPRIIEAYDYGLTVSGPYYTMELLDGADLLRLSPLPVEQTCRYLRDLASSLALIHAHRLLHRDVTPRNARVTPDGRCKLIDFGALGGFGLASELVATPAYSSPEVLRRQSLDPRSDLFALGAVAYFALTGRHPFNGHRLDVLEQLWSKPPPAPSKFADDVSPELDSLVLSLLNVDPLARPSSAAAVIDRLNVLAGLPPEDELAAESYLSSGRIVGRAKELAFGHNCVAHALTHGGSSLLLEGPLGIGRTRLLEELALEAQLRGMVVLKADAQATAGSFGLASALALQLLARCPDLARRQAQPYAGLLGHLHVELREKLESPPLTPLSANPTERLAQFQDALHEWFSSVARQSALLVATDNLQAADESSAAFLAALAGKARDLPLLVLSTLRSDEPINAPGPIKALRKRSDRFELSSFDLAGCEAFVKSLFGDVENAGRVARSLREHSGGNPRHCMDLARLLVQRNVVKYAAGAWVLPIQLTHTQLPSRVDEIVAAKLANLSADARELVEALSIHTRPVSLERCLQSSAHARPQALAALDELVAADILLVEGATYRFVQQNLGAAVLARLDAAARRERHLRAAEALLSGDTEDLQLRMEAGWHLLHGGDDRRGADLLAATARAYLQGGHATESVDPIVTALVAAFEAYERQRRSEHERAALLFALVPLSYYGTDWRITTRYAMRAAELALRLSGLGLARLLRPWLGKRLALRCGAAVARWRGARARERGQPFELQAMIVAFGAMQPTALGTFCVCIDVPAAHRIARLFEALELLPSTPFLDLIRCWRQAMLHTLDGRERESMEAFERVGEHLRNPIIAALVGEGRRRSMHGGSSYARALLEAYCSSPRALERAQEIEQLGMRFWAVNANQVRRLYYAYRGEIRLAERCHEQLENFATQGGSTWQSEMFWPAALLDAHVLSSDIIATRRTWEQLARLAEDVPTLRRYADAAQAAYLMLRGELERAIELYQRLLPDFPVQYGMSWLPTRTYFARALNLAGRHAQAKRVMVDALARTHAKDAVVAMHFGEARRQLALAEAGLGDRARALAILTELFEMYGPLENPLLLGLFHEARALVALQALDRTEFDAQLERVHGYFRATENPALIALWEQLRDRAAQVGLRPSLEPSTRGPDSVEPISVEHSLAELSAATNRRGCALRLILQRAHAQHGYLYLWQAQALQLVEAVGDGAPPLDVTAELIRAVRSLAEQDDEDGLTIASLSDPPSQAPGVRASARAANDNESSPLQSQQARSPSDYQCFVLTTRQTGQRKVVGGVIVEMPASDLFRLDHDFRATIADALAQPSLGAAPSSRPRGSDRS